MEAPGLFSPDWEVPGNVRAIQTTRRGGFSRGPWSGFNLALHTGDDPERVQRNRALLTSTLGLPQAPQWPQQVHGVKVVDADRLPAPGTCGQVEAEPEVEAGLEAEVEAEVEAKVEAKVEADAVMTRIPGVVCSIQTADCLPVLFATEDGSAVAAAHAGWRGLCHGVLEATLAALAIDPSRITVWLGPAIGPAAFEVGPEVRDSFCTDDADAAGAFVAGIGDRWYADLYALARLRLRRAGVQRISGGGYCTYSSPDEFFSYRRDGVTGRMATLIWMELP